MTPTGRRPDSFGLMARGAGALWIVTILCGIFAEAYARGQLIVTDNPGATADNIMAAQNLFRFGLVADLVTATSMAGATVILYEIFRSSSRPLALGQLSFGLSGCIILAAGLATLSEPLILLGRLTTRNDIHHDSRNDRVVRVAFGEKLWHRVQVPTHRLQGIGLEGWHWRLLGQTCSLR